MACPPGGIDRPRFPGAATGGETLTEQGEPLAPRPTTVMRPGQPLGLRLDARQDEFRELLLDCSLEDVGPSAAPA